MRSSDWSSDVCSSDLKNVPNSYMPMLNTAEYISRKYNISRDVQDEYSLQSQLRTARAQQEGRFAGEIVPITTEMWVKDKETGQTSLKLITLEQDEGNRTSTTRESIASLQPGIEGGVITDRTSTRLNSSH